MTTAREVDGTRESERERLDADRRYNDALTALDREIVQLTTGAADPDALARTSTALIVFLQQITAFVDTKNREAAARIGARLMAIERALEPIAELRTQITVLHRAVQSITRATVSPQPSPLSPQPSALSPQPSIYVAFEDQFRGSQEAVGERLRTYVPIFRGAGDATVVDLGCGRGELLDALKSAGIKARGVDVNADMVAIARERGLDAIHGDALSVLSSLDDGSLGGIIATQVVEHLEPQYLMRLLDTAALKLRSGTPIVLETINPACWLAFFSSYIRDFTHVRPLHPETLQYLLRAAGFERVELRYSAPVPDHMKMKAVDLPPQVLAARDDTSIALASVAHAINANAVILNNLMFTHLDYAAIGYKA